MAYDPLTGKPIPSTTSYNPLSGIRTSPIPTTQPNVAYRPESGTTIPGYSTISQYVDTRVAAMPKAKKIKTRTPKLDKNGKIIGWDLVYDDDTTGFEPNPDYRADEETSSTGNLSLDAFVNTLTLLMGKEEASKAYVKELYGIVSKFYKQGSTISDSINLALYQAKEQKAIPEFTNRFSGIFALQERRAKGEAIDVPTIAEYIKSQQRLGEILRRSALGDLANESFLNTVMATGKSVDESTQIITDVFDLIDNAPEVFKKELSNRFPTVTRAQLATALLTGPQGIKQLESTVKRAGVVAAGTAQGLKISESLAEDLASKGQSFASAGAGFLRTAQILPVAQKLTSIETGIEPEKAYTTEQAVAATFDQSAAELKRLADLAERERARLSGSAGTAGSRSLASQNRGLGLI